MIISTLREGDYKRRKKWAGVWLKGRKHEVERRWRWVRGKSWGWSDDCLKDLDGGGAQVGWRCLGVGIGGRTGAAMNQRLVDVGGKESWVGVPVHQHVDLQLGVFKGVWRRILHLPVDHLSNPSIQTHLEGKTHFDATKQFRFHYIKKQCD